MPPHSLREPVVPLMTLKVAVPVPCKVIWFRNICWQADTEAQAVEGALGFVIHAVPALVLVALFNSQAKA